MDIHLEPYQLISLIIAALGIFFGGGRLLLSQIDKRLDTRFSSLEASAKQGDTEIRNILGQHILDESKTNDQLINLERQMLTWKADLPLQYVRREDFIRNQTVIESKLDGLALKLENNQLRGGNNG